MRGRGLRCRIAEVAILLAAAAAGRAVAANDTQAATPTPEPAAPYVVVLADGSSAVARTKPVSAFGSVRFVDQQGRTVVLPSGEVDLATTRERNREVAVPAGAGTVSFAVDPVMAAPEPADAATTPAPAARGPEPAVRVYSATWCGPCRHLHQFLHEQHIEAVVTEVDRLPPAEQARATAEMQRLTGRVSYPTVVIGGEAHAGFSPQWILQALGRRPAR